MAVVYFTPRNIVERHCADEETLLGPSACGLLQAQAERVAALETELRRSKRREEKLTALQYRLREDLKAGGGDARCGSAMPPSLFSRHHHAAVKRKHGKD